MQFMPKIGFNDNKKLFYQSSDSAYQFSEYEDCRFTEFNSIHQSKSYVPVAGCLLDHIISTTNLSLPEKLYYLLADALCIINNNTGKKRAVALSSFKWSEILRCSRPQVFAMQKSLEQKGYFFVSKEKNKSGQDNRNLITTTLPNAVFEDLRLLPGNTKCKNKERLFNPLIDSKRAYLDSTKMFVRINYTMLKSIISSEELSDFQKVAWLDFYSKAYKAHVSSDSSDRFSFITSYPELMEQYSCSNKRISRGITELEKAGFIYRERFYIKGNEGVQARQDKPLWQITLTLPYSYAQQLVLLQDRANLKVKSGFAEKVKEIADTGQEIKEGHTTAPNQSRVGTGINGYAQETAMAQPQKKVFAEKIEQVPLINTAPGPGLQVSGNISDEVGYTLNLQHEPEQSKEEFSLSPDPACSSGLPSTINKYFKIKKNIKSNLEQNSEVALNFSSENVFKNKFIKKHQLKLKKQSEFNICSELIRKKLKVLPKDKADKARKYAYALSSKKLAKGYASTIGKHELAKQLLFHATTWKPKQYSYLSTEDQIDVALATAWKAVENGTWQAPLGWAKAQILQYEFQHYKDKYQKTGVLSSYEITELEKSVSNLLEERFYGTMEYKITLGNSETQKSQKTEDNHTCHLCQGHSSQALEPQKSLVDYIYQSEDYYNHLLVKEGLVDEEHRYYSEDDIATKTDLSSLPDEQRQIILTPSDEKGLKGIIFETSGKKQYLLNVKSFETNIYGDTVMVLEKTGSAVLLKNQNSDAANSGIVDVSIDNFLNNIKHIDTNNTDTSNVIQTGKNYLGQAQEL